MNTPTKYPSQQNTGDDIDLRPFFDVIKRKIKFVLTLPIVFSSISVIYALTVDPVYKGGFEIVVEDKNQKRRGSTQTQLQQVWRSSLSLQDSDLKTQEFILKSPSVLMPVFDYVKSKNKISKGKSSAELDYKSWLNKNLDISFTEDTKILSIAYKDKNKDHIVDVLNLISDKYKAYSKKDREKQLTKTITYLNKQQQIYKEKALIARKEFNTFAIENGLADIDGFVDFDNSEKEEMEMRRRQLNTNTSLGQTTLTQDFSGGRNSGAGKRYKEQFRILERYESHYVDMASRLKPESEYLKNLNIKITKLKNSLKRPNEILLKFRELQTLAKRKENILNNIENELVEMSLEKVKQQEPWQMISKPTIDKSRLSPKRSQIVLGTFFLSFLSSSFLSYLYEKASGKIYNLKELKSKINLNFLETLYLFDKDLAKKQIQFLINESKIKNNLGIVFADKTQEDDLNNKILINQDLSKLKIANIFEDESINSCEKVLLIIEQGKCTQKDIEILNKYIGIYKNKFIGWVYVQESN